MKKHEVGVALVVALTVIFIGYQRHLNTDFIATKKEASSGLRVKHARSRLEFVSYTSSEWELMWLKNVDKWIKPKDGNEACHQLFHDQARYMHDFLKRMCTTRFAPPFEDICLFDDFSKAKLYYNTSNREKFDLSFKPPLGGPMKPQRAEPVVPSKDGEHVFSKFVYRDTSTGENIVEYIEPLVSHLRFPFAGCPEGKIDFVLTKSYILPPDPKIRSTRRRFTNSPMQKTNPYHERYLYFDAGASSWSQGAGGPSLEYFSNMWQRHGIVFDDIFAFEANTSADQFYQSIPNLFWSDRTFYQQGYVSSRPEDDTPATPFIPKFIQRHATVDDYVIFKLDIDSPGIEEANIDFLLDPKESNGAYRWIDELFWEHHVFDNPFMRGLWFQYRSPVNGTDPTLRGSYNKFLKMRQLGIRAHSWI